MKITYDVSCILVGGHTWGFKKTYEVEEPDSFDAIIGLWPRNDIELVNDILKIEDLDQVTSIVVEEVE